MEIPTSPSPRPTPKFFKELQTFSTKKERGTPRDSLPPRPPVKSAPPVSRIFSPTFSNKAKPVSFRGLEPFLSPRYDETNKDLYFNQCFEILCKMGAGSFGEVYKVRSKENGRFYAIKKSREKFRGEADRRRKLEEVAKHEKLPYHQNCIRIERAWEERQHLYIQTELCDTNLSSFAEKQHDIPETSIWNYLVDLLMAVKHLHNHNLVHMDIKLENIFLSYEGICKLGDFGLVLDLSKSRDLSDAQEGDPKYLAPELLDGKFGKSADIFSLGMTILELASDLDLPRGGEGWHILRHGKLPEEFLQMRSFDLKYVIKQMLDPDPSSRPTVDQLLAFPCVRKMWKRRIREYMLKNVVSKAKHVFHKILGIFSMLFTLVFTYPFQKIQASFKSTQQSRTNVDSLLLDDTISDDEGIEDNMACTLMEQFDSSSSSEGLNCSGQGEFILPGIATRRKAFSAPKPRVRHRYEQSQFRPRHAYSHLDVPVKQLKSSRIFSDCSSPEINRPVTPTYTSFLHEEQLRPSIEPKNLMEMFEAASDDD